MAGHNAEEVMNAYRGIVALLNGAGYAITNVPDPVLRDSLNRRLVDFMGKLNAWHDDWWGKLQGDFVHKTAAAYWIPGPNTIKADSALLIHRVWAEKLFDDVMAVQPPDEKGLKIKAIMQQGKPLFKESKLYVDTLDELYESIKKALQRIAEGLWYLVKWGLIAYGSYWVLKRAFGKRTAAPAVPKPPKPVKLTRKQRKKKKRAQQLLRESQASQRQAQELLAELPSLPKPWGPARY